MDIQIQKELKEICTIKKYLANDTLEAYLEYASLYSKESWLSLQEEFLFRMTNEIAIL